MTGEKVILGARMSCGDAHYASAALKTRSLNNQLLQFFRQKGL